MKKSAQFITAGALAAAGFMAGRYSVFTVGDVPAQAVSQATRQTAPALPPAPAAPRAAVEDGEPLLPAAAASRMWEVYQTRDRIQRLNLLTSLLQRMDKNTVAAVSEVVSANWKNGAAAGEESSLIQFREGQLLGKDMMTGLPAEPNGSLNGSSLPNKLRGWASADPEAAKAWLATLPDGKVKESLMKSWVEGAIMKDPGQLIDKLAEVPDSLRGAVVSTTMEDIHRNGGMPALNDWFDRFSGSHADEPKLVSAAMAGLAGRVSQSGDPVAMKEFVTKNAESPYISPAALTKINEKLAATDLDASMGFLSDFTLKRTDFQPELPNMLRAIVDVATSANINGMGEWLNGHKTSPIYDVIATQYSERLLRDDPAAATQWARTINDPSMRNAALKNTGAEEEH